MGMAYHPGWWFVRLASLVAVVGAGPAADGAPFRVEVVEQGSGWPVPLVELRTTHGLRCVSDNAGVIAIDAPDVMGVPTWFSVHGHGYGVAPDGFGHEGVRLVPRPGESTRLEVRRTILARRIGRLTGGGRFAEAQRAGVADGDCRDTPGVFGCDSVQTATYRGSTFWVWGDTTEPRYPLGIFAATGAAGPVPPLAWREPPLRVVFDLFRDPDGRPRGICPMPGAGPTWVSGLATVPDAAGRERLVASYVKIRNRLDPYEIGLCVWDDAADRFMQHAVVWTRGDDSPQQPAFPDGHAARWRDAEGRDWLLFGNPLPRLRCPATFEAWSDRRTWETLAAPAELETVDGGRVVLHSGAIGRHEGLGRWCTVFTERFGATSAFGEVWYAEADAPQGPWGPAVKVLSHDNQTFYNPALHLAADDTGPPILLFEGTFTATFANHAEPTPRYEYNQILYRLDLDDPAIARVRSR